MAFKWNEKELNNYYNGNKKKQGKKLFSPFHSNHSGSLLKYKFQRLTSGMSAQAPRICIVLRQDATLNLKPAILLPRPPESWACGHTLPHRAVVGPKRTPNLHGFQGSKSSHQVCRANVFSPAEPSHRGNASLRRGSDAVHPALHWDHYWCCCTTSSVS